MTRLADHPGPGVAQVAAREIRSGDHAGSRPGPGAEPLPRYTGARIAICPDTGAELTTEPDGFWCPECDDLHPFNLVVMPGEPDYDD